MTTQTLSSQPDASYAQAMGHLLVLYTQVDHFIMQACAERLASAPGDEAVMGLAKQVGDECRHVTIQRRWMQAFGVDERPVIDEATLDELRAHFRALDWPDFLTDLYVVIEALGSQAVEQIVPLADPGTRESLRIPLADELDHVAFGLDELRKALDAMPEHERSERIERMPARIAALTGRLQGMGLPVNKWFAAVGSDYIQVCAALEKRRTELLETLAA